MRSMAEAGDVILSGYRIKKKQEKMLTDTPDIFYNGSMKIYKHCKNIVAMDEDGIIYVHCRHCKRWVKIYNIDK